MNWFSRASHLLARMNETGPTGSQAAAHSQAKLDAIASYAEFCRTGTSPAYPLEIFLEISNVCDLKCAMCVQFSALNVHRLNQIKGTARGFMDQDEVSGHLEEALKHAVLVHCFGYGEPTIHPTFRSFLDLVSRHEVMIDFFTNGMHLDEEFCQFLVERGIYRITVSFSGATREIYESIYLGGDFDTVLAGMKRLADAKKAKGSHYPIIEINSLAFRDHVDHFDDFVSLMADHGANVVMLKPLQAYKTIPELYEHVSIMRPQVEGKIVERAVRLGKQRGLEVNASLYMQTAATSEQDFEEQVSELRGQAEQAFGETGRKFGLNPVSQFAMLATELEPLRNPEKRTASPKVLSLDSPRPVARLLTKVARAEGDAEPFYCMEPFKTLYISRNGGAKSCCFANPGSWYLGNAKQDDALAVWRGEGFDMTRAAIAGGEYPMKTCGACIKGGYGPQGHFVSEMLRTYLTWHRRNFKEDLRAEIEGRIPGMLQLIGRTAPEIMANARRSTTQTISARLSSHTPRQPDAQEFATTRWSYLHRDFQLSGKSARLFRKPPPGLSGELLRLLYACGQRHYGGKGVIVDLGLPSGALQALLSGLRANPGIHDIRGAFEKRRDAIVERFGLEGSQDDGLAADAFVKPAVADAANIRWLASKPIEICLVQTGVRSARFQRAFRQLVPFFVPGQTLVVLSQFYFQTDFRAKVLMGFLSESFEWLGQAGPAAIFRYVQAARPEYAAVDPAEDLPAELCQHFHRLWQDRRLGRTVQLRLELSYSQLLSKMVGVPSASDHVEALRQAYGDILDPTAAGSRTCNELLTRFSERYKRDEAPSSGAGTTPGLHA